MPSRISGSSSSSSLSGKNLPPCSISSSCRKSSSDRANCKSSDSRSSSSSRVAFDELSPPRSTCWFASKASRVRTCDVSSPLVVVVVLSALEAAEADVWTLESLCDAANPNSDASCEIGAAACFLLEPFLELFRFLAMLLAIY
jgi:hypothetical protein